MHRPTPTLVDKIGPNQEQGYKGHQNTNTNEILNGVPTIGNGITKRGVEGTRLRVG